MFHSLTITESPCIQVGTPFSLGLAVHTDSAHVLVSGLQMLNNQCRLISWQTKASGAIPIPIIHTLHFYFDMDIIFKGLNGWLP